MRNVTFWFSLTISRRRCRSRRRCLKSLIIQSRQQTGGSSVEFASDPDSNVIDFGNGSDFYNDMVPKDLHKATILKKMAIAIEL